MALQPGYQCTEHAAREVHPLSPPTRASQTPELPLRSPVLKPPTFFLECGGGQAKASARSSPPTCQSYGNRTTQDTAFLPARRQGLAHKDPCLQTSGSAGDSKETVMAPLYLYPETSCASPSWPGGPVRQADTARRCWSWAGPGIAPAGPAFPTLRASLSSFKTK